MFYRNPLSEAQIVFVSRRKCLNFALIKRLERFKKVASDFEVVGFVLDVLGGDYSDNRFSFEEITGEYSEVGGEFFGAVWLVSPHIDQFIDSLYFSSVSLDVSDDGLEQIEEIERLVFAEALEDRVALWGAEEADHLVDDIFDGVSGVDSSLESTV